MPASRAAAPARATAEAWRKAHNVLAIRLDSLGDVLMTTPAIRALRESGPADRRITLLTSPAGAAVAGLVPEIDEVLVFEAPWLKASGPIDGTGVRAMADGLAARGFDAAAIFTVYSQNPLPSAMLCHLAGIPLRLAHCHENPYQLLTDWIPDPEPETLTRHEVQRQLDLVGAVGARTEDERLSLAVPEEARGSLDAKLAALPIDPSAPWIVVHPGASAPSRRYPAEQFAVAVRGFVRDLGAAVVFTGTAPERDLADGIREASGVSSASLVGELSLAELAALIERAPLLVANNTGPVHVAAAVGTPVVDLYALTNPQHGPWGVASRVLSHDVPCRNCYKSVCPMGHHDCLRKVDPAEVVAAAGELLGRRPAAERANRPWRSFRTVRRALPLAPGER